MEHELKTWPDYFDRIIDGTKTFELRYGDRLFEVGDTLHLREWSPDSEEYTGREVRVEVSYLLRASDLLADGFVCMGLSNARVEVLDELVRGLRGDILAGEVFARAGAARVAELEAEKLALDTCWRCKVSLDKVGPPERRVPRCTECPEPESMDEVDVIQGGEGK